MASSKEYSYLAIDPGEIPVEDDLLMVTTNWVFVTKLFPFDSNRNMVSLENRKLLIECINESTEEVLLTTIDMHDRNLVEQKEEDSAVIRYFADDEEGEEGEEREAGAVVCAVG